MATRGKTSREERLERRNQLKEDKRRELQTTLEEQGVYLSDEDISDIHVTIDEQGNGSFYSESDQEETLTEEEEEDSQRLRSTEIKEKTDQFIKERSYIEQRFLEIDKREREAQQREQDLENRRLAFEKALKEKEEIERKKIRRKVQERKKKEKEEMYQDSLRILKELEEDMLYKKQVSEQRERELEAREQEIRMAEENWKLKEREMERCLRERLRHEVEEEMRREIPASTPIPQRIRKQEETLVSKKDAEYKGAPSLEQTERWRNTGVTGFTNEKQQRFEDSGAKPKLRQQMVNETAERWRETDETGSKYEWKHSFKDSEIYPKDKEKEQGTLDDHLKDDSKGKESSEKKNTDSGFIQKPFVGTFSGADPKPKHENSFEDWRMEVESLIAAKSYSDISITQAIRKSLKVPAKKVLLPMSITSTPREIIAKLENVYGNVACGQAILQEFYTAEQSSDESVADWALRLEELMKRAVDKGHTKEGEKDKMISTKFWRGLFNQDLKNATKMFYEAEKGFDSLLLKVRSEEYELSQSKTRTEDKKKKAQHHPLQGSSDKQLELLNSLMEKMNSMDKKVNRLESKVGADRGGFDKGRDNFNKGGGRGRGRGRGRGYDYAKEESQTENEQKIVGQQNQNENRQKGIEGETDHSKNV